MDRTGDVSFATMQIGGAWFLSFLGKAADSSVPFCFGLRAVGIFLTSFQTAMVDLFGATGVGLSHSIFYKSFTERAL